MPADPGEKDVPRAGGNRRGGQSPADHAGGEIGTANSTPWSESPCVWQRARAETSSESQPSAVRFRPPEGVRVSVPVGRLGVRRVERYPEKTGLVVFVFGGTGILAGVSDPTPTNGSGSARTWSMGEPRSARPANKETPARMPLPPRQKTNTARHPRQCSRVGIFSPAVHLTPSRRAESTPAARVGAPGRNPPAPCR